MDFKRPKYVDAKVVFKEIPDEITLAISVSGCKIHCPDCHSKYLWEDIGTEINRDSVSTLIQQNKGISCICFMGGNLEDLEYELFWVHTRYPSLKIAWYTGESEIPRTNLVKYLDYIKVGPYIKEKGGLDNPNTNQRFYAKGRVLHKLSAYDNSFYDITDKFWKNGDKDN